MNTYSHVPPGFRFHPTDEELVDYYLRKKVNSNRIDLDVIKDVDLYKIEPWDLQELCRLGTEEQNEWYFFSHKDKKYPTGTRTNRATAAGFWKATGRDKAIYSKHDLIGMRKTLVFYKGRAPNGQKSDWIMHEYRLETDENGTPQEEGWVVCRVFKKRVTSMRKLSEHDSPCWYDDQVSFMQDLDSSSKQISQPNNDNNLVYQHFPHPNCNKRVDQDLPLNIHLPREHFLHQLPLLDNPKLLQSASTMNSNNPMAAYGNMGENYATPSSSIMQQEQVQAVFGNNTTNEQAAVADWRVLDKLVSSQLSQEDAVSAGNPFHHMKNNGGNNVQFKDWDKQEIMPADNNASTSNSSCPMDMWK